MAADPYLLPGTNTLKNLAGINSFVDLQHFEAVSTAQRISELRLEPIRGSFDVPHLQRVHRYIFQDVYSWAGVFRTVDMKTEGGSWFCRPEFIQQSLINLLADLEREKKMKGAKQDEFCSRAAHYTSELNAIHPFREGNGRTQREFIRELGVQAGFLVDWSRVTREEMYAASIASFEKGDNRPSVHMITNITTQLGPEEGMGPD